MDVGYLFSILARRKWLILSAMLATAAVVFYLIGRRPERYKASVILSTGIVNYKGLNSNGDDAFVQQFQIENAFSNLMEFAQSRSSIKIVTLHMLKHDLNAENSANNTWPFRPPNLKLYGEGINAESQTLLQKLNTIQLDTISDPAFSQEMDYLIDRVSRTYGYDHDAILRSLTVKRKGNTDYLVIEVTTENPALSQYLANTYVELFRTYYHNLSVREKRKNVKFYAQLAIEKKMALDTIIARYYNYLRSRNLPSLGKQSEELISQLSDLEMQRQKAESKRMSAVEEVSQIQQYIDQRGNLDAGETRTRVVDKYNIADLNSKVRELTDRSGQAGGKDARIEAELAGARHALDVAIASSAGNLGKNSKQLDESRRTKEDLYKEKVRADLDRIEAEKSLSTLNGEIGSRRGQLSTFVSNDQVASGLSDEQKRAEEEFAKVNEELINAKLSLANTENPLHVIENAQLPEWPEPNRQVLLSVFSAIVIGTMVVIGLFLLAYFDRSIQSPELFRQYTKNLPLMGITPFISVKNLDFNTVFSSNGNMPQYGVFRESLRKLRNAVINSGGKTFLFTSTQSQQGKTLTAYALAHALAVNHKRVVLVDTNFKTPLPEPLSTSNSGSGTIKKIIRDNGLAEIFYPGHQSGVGMGLVGIIAHEGAHLSPAELLPPDQFRKFLSDLTAHFDYVFLEGAALNQFSDAEELIPFVDKVIAVFNASSVLHAADQASIEYLRSLDQRFAGAILAGVDEQV